METQLVWWLGTCDKSFPLSLSELRLLEDHLDLNPILYQYIKPISWTTANISLRYTLSAPHTYRKLQYGCAQGPPRYNSLFGLS
jgi:hypothetical protein